MKVILAFFAIVTFVAVLNTNATGQSAPAAPPQPVNLRGSVVDRKYSNPYFGFELDLPKNWISLGKEDTEAAINMTGEALMSENAAANKLLETATANSVTLLFYAKGPLGSMDNASIALTATRLSSKFVTAKMVLEATKSALLKNPNTTLVSDVETELISGQQFAKMEIKTDHLAPIRYFVTIARGYAVTTSLSSLDKNAWFAVEESFRTIKFKAK